MKHIISILSIVFSTMACYAQESINQEVVLNVGPVQITKYEFEKNFNRVFPASAENNQSQKKEWIKYYINQTYFLADAYLKGYIDDQRVNYDVTRVGKYMLTQPYGLYEQKTLFSAIKITEQEIFREYEKRSKYLVSYFFFKSANEMNNCFSNKIPKTKKEFESAVKMHTELRYNNFFDDTLLCPCQFNEKRIGLDTIQENQVSQPFVTPEGIYLFLIKKKGNIPEKYNETEKKKITEYLTTQKKDSIRKKNQEQLLKTLSIVSDSAIVKDIVNRSQKDIHYRQNNYAIDKTLFEDIQGKKLFEYKDGEIIKSVNLSEFINYFNQRIIREPISEQSIINTYIENFPVEEIYYKEALNLGMDKEIKYQMDEKNYRNNVINYYYDKDNFYDSIKIPDQEIIDFYYKNINQFRDTDAINISVFYFNTIENAQKTIRLIKNIKNLNDTLNYLKENNGLLEYNLKEDFSNLENLYKHRISSILKKLSINELSKPIEIKGRFLVIRKYVEPGVRTKPFIEVKADVRESIYQRKLEKMKAQRLSQLKQKFELKSTIDHGQYL
jgi:hypothetical protein